VTTSCKVLHWFLAFNFVSHDAHGHALHVVLLHFGLNLCVEGFELGVGYDQKRVTVLCFVAFLHALFNGILDSHGSYHLKPKCVIPLSYHSIFSLS
jgi:hypothetical protein